ncbi:MAG: hypothetical protein JJT95_18360 [Pararhodobacter sp.]|nr:hypothetical protein [Pararhodobacter sp.]
MSSGKTKPEVPAPAPVEQRRERLSRAIEGVEPGHYAPLPGGLRALPVARVGADLLVYRVDNGRLVAELTERLRKEQRDWETLRREAASAEVQTMLHGLLMAAAADLRGPILQELERQGRQTEPLLVTAEGVVVNGNRRLAAMRALRTRDPERYADFAQVAVAVLPADIAPADLDFVEAALQMAPETKLGYGWINRRVKLRRQRDELGLPQEWILEAYQLADAALLAREIAELELAEAYLAEWCDTPGRYGAVAEEEPLFAGLNAQLASLPEELRPLWRWIGFALIAMRGKLDGAPERGFPFVAPGAGHLPVAALRRLAQLRGLTGAEEEAALAPALREDLRALFPARGEVQPVLEELLEIIAVFEEEHREHKRPSAVLQRIKGVRRRLDRLDPERLDRDQQRVLRSELAAIQAQAAYLLGEHPETRFEQQKTGLVKALSRVWRRWRDR